MNYSSKLEIILGPMFSGKTTKLLEIMDTLDEQNIKYIAVKPEIDNRYTDDNNNFIVSHNLKKRECQVVSNLKDVLKEIQKSKTIPATRSDSIEYVIVDEGQFFQNLYLFCLICLEKFNVNVIVTGLDGDYERKPMGEILDLLPIANNITKLSARCNICNAEAIFTHRTSTEKEQVLIGGSDKYVPLCRYHYVLENNLISNSLEFS
jgi:thymidine kinase